MFARKMELELKKWKESLSIKRKAFILKGLRQVGKTFIVKKFAQENYKNVIYINFKVELDMKQCFNNNLSVDNLIMNISSMKPGTLFIPYETVLIFDETEPHTRLLGIQPFYYLFSLYIDITSSLFSKNKSTKFGSKSVPLPSSIILKQVSNGRASL